MRTKGFSRALLYHLQWKVRFRTFLDGEGQFNAEELFPEHCAFGKWLCSDQIVRYASPLEIGEIEEVHMKLHEAALRAYARKLSGNDAAARQESRKMEVIGMELATLLITLASISAFREEPAPDHTLNASSHAVRRFPDSTLRTAPGV